MPMLMTGHDWTLLAVVHKPADRPAVGAALKSTVPEVIQFLSFFLNCV